MPAGGGAANAGMPGQEPLDLGVCISILKKAIVLLPVLIMLIIYLVKVTLTHEDYQGGERGLTGNSSIDLLMSNVSDILTVLDQNSDSNSRKDSNSSSLILSALQNRTKLPEE